MYVQRAHHPTTRDRVTIELRDDARLACRRPPPLFHRATCVERDRHVGLALADIARHVANALHDATGADIEDSVDRIRYMFNAELLNPTETPKGEVI